MKFLLYIMLLTSCTFFVCCTSPRIEWAMRDNPVGIPFSPKNVYSADALPKGLHRVLFMPVKSERVSSKELARLTDVFLSELRRSERFSVVEAAPTQQLIQANKDASLDLNQLSVLADQYDVQGILQLEVTHLRAYKPLHLGVKARLFTLDPENLQVLWALDSLFDAGQDSVALGARMHAQSYNQQVFPLSSSYTNLNVPSRFAAYVAYTIFNTLPKI